MCESVKIHTNEKPSDYCYRTIFSKNDIPVGEIQYIYIPGTPDVNITCLNVYPGYRGNGYSYCILKHFVDIIETSTQGISEITLGDFSSLSGNPRSIYTKLGCLPLTRRIKYTDDPERKCPLGVFKENLNKLI